MSSKCCLSIAVFLYQIIVGNSQLYTSPNFFKPRFITGTTNGLYAAVVFPIDLPGREAYLGWFFEAIHTLPSNQTEYVYPPEVERQIDRKYIYNVVENKIKSKCIQGKACLLRSICEVGINSLQSFSGVLGDILHMILTPSSSKNSNLPSEYLNAEIFGKENGHCEAYINNCKISILGLFSKLVS